MTSYNPNEGYDYLFKIILVGDSGVGKSNILGRMTRGEFSQDSKATIGVEFSTKHTIVNSGSNSVKVKGQIWDTSGQERFRCITSAFYRGAVGVIVVYDIAMRSSFDNIQKWLDEIKDRADPSIVTIIVGNKCDLDHLRTVKRQEGEDMAQELYVTFMETSALDNRGIEEAYAAMVEQIYDRIKMVADDPDLPMEEPQNGRPINIGEDEETKKPDSKCC